MSSMTPDDFDVDYDDLLLGKSRDPTPLHAPQPAGAHAARPQQDLAAKLCRYSIGTVPAPWAGHFQC